MNESIYSLGNTIFKALNARGGCTLMLGLLCIWLAYKDHTNRMLNEQNHKIQMEMVGELREIKGILIMKNSSLMRSNGTHPYAGRPAAASRPLAGGYQYIPRDQEVEPLVGEALRRIAEARRPEQAQMER